MFDLFNCSIICVSAAILCYALQIIWRARQDSFTQADIARLEEAARRDDERRKNPPAPPMRYAIYRGGNHESLQWGDTGRAYRSALGKEPFLFRPAGCGLAYPVHESELEFVDSL